MKKYVLLILLVVSIIFLPNIVMSEDEDNTSLKIMRTNKENIVPNFVLAPSLIADIQQYFNNFGISL